MVGEVAKGVYDGFMNTGDILLSALLGAKAGAVINALSGFSEGFWQAKDQGAADDSAFNYALLSQIPQIALDWLGLKDNKNILAQTWDANKDMFARWLENIKAQSVTGASNQTTKLFLEDIFLSDASKSKKVYDEAYQKAIDEGADIAEAQNAGRIAQMNKMG